jgi:hypothetical protein
VSEPDAIVVDRPRRSLGPGPVAIAATLGLGAFAYAMSRRRILRRGTTPAEAAARLPGDELLEDTDGVSTRAIDIHAAASAVGRGSRRWGRRPAAAHTYDWIESVLGLNPQSVDAVLPQFQHPEVGDSIEFGSNRMRLGPVQPDRVLARRSADGNWVWSFVLTQHEGSTRMISRNRFRPPTLAHRHGADGGGFTRDGAQDAARDPTASRTIQSGLTP